MDKYKNLLKCAGFLLGLAICIFVASRIFRRKDGLYVYNSLAVSMRVADVTAEPHNSLDILFCGDSECYGTFSPNHLYAKYGYTSYVCGTSGQRICDTYAILKDSFKAQTPKVVVLETNCLYRKIKTDEEKKDWVMNRLTDSVPLFANHTDWKMYLRRLLPKNREDKRRSRKGFVVRKDAKPYKGGKHMKQTKKKKKIPKENISYLEQIADLCAENHADLLLVSVPSPKNWNYKKHNAVEEWAAAHGISYLDLNLSKELNMNWRTDTLDAGDHLNLKGAKKVTKYMGKYLDANYSLTDHRNGE